MRRAPTPAEAAFWNHLRNQQRGTRFRRQVPIDRFIVDFYCPEARLVVEIDGEIHKEQQEEDAVRQTHLERLGLRVLRFSNEDVLVRLRKVLGAIDRVTREEIQRLQTLGVHPGPLPKYKSKTPN